MIFAALQKIYRKHLSKDYNRPLPTGRNKKVIGIMSYELGGKVTTEFVALKANIYLCKKIRQKVGR